MLRFRHIDFPGVLYETLRAYYSVNSDGAPSWLYKYCAALIQPLQGPWNDYEANRAKTGLIAQSKFQVGQLAAVLNYLYDAPLNRIYITQSYYAQTVARSFSEAPILFGRGFSETPIAFARGFGEALKYVGAVIHVPASDNVSQLTATVAQLAIPGLEYTIVTFT